MIAIKPRLPLSVLKANRNVRNLWIGETVSYFGDFFYDIAMMWYVFQKTGSGLQMGLILVTSFAPQVIAGPLLGAIADRVRRKRMMQVASVVQACLTGLLALAIWTGQARLWQVYLVTVLLALAQLAYTPARSGMFPDIVDKADLMAANSLFSVSQQLARLIGSTVGGTVMAIVNAGPAIGFDALTFVVSAWSIGRVAYTPAAVSDQTSARASMLQDIRAGWGWLAKKPVMLVLIGIGTVANIALGPTNVLPPMIVSHDLHASAAALGVFDASIGCGILVGGLVIGSITVHRIGLMYACGIGLEGIAMSFVAIAPNLWMACIGNFVLGVAVIVAGLPMGTLFQVLVPAAMRGRVNAISSALFSFAIPITYGGIGILGDAIGARWSYGLGAALAVSCMIAGLSAVGLRRLSITDKASAPGVEGVVV